MDNEYTAAHYGPPDHELTPDQLDDKYNPDGDGEHPTWAQFEWRQAVATESTLCGYWEWVACQLEAEHES